MTVNTPQSYTTGVNRQRVFESFKAVAELWAPSGQEKIVADKIVDEFKSLDLPGAKVMVDETGPASQSDTGNVIFDIPATPDAPANAPGIGLFFHMDRVPARAEGVPADEPVKLALDADGKIHSQGYRTNISADDRAGYAEIREALQVIKDNKLPHGRLLVVGFTNEETTSGGAANIDKKHFEGINYGYAMDGGDIEELMRGGSAITTWQADIHGKAAHSGVEPEKGVSAIQGATDGVANLGKLGLVKEGQTLNVAYIKGGTAEDNGDPLYNVIPDHCFVAGEFRALTPQDQTELTDKVNGAFAKAQKDRNVDVKVTMQTEAGFYLPDDAAVVKFAEAGMLRAGVTATKTFEMAGSDASPLNAEKGLPTVLLGNGVQQMHTVQEHINIADLEKGSQVILGLIQQGVS